MRNAPALLERAYAFHGVDVTVAADDPLVHDAMDLRLRAFPRGTGGPGVRLEFRTAGPARDEAPQASRPVYETPYGDLLYDDAGDRLTGELDGVRLECAAGAGLAVLTSPDFRGRRLYLATHPLATISLMELLERRDRHALHAGCVASDEAAGVLLAGPSGAGKSTLTFALARAGMRFLSDDTVFLAPDRGGVTVLGFSDAIGVTEATADRFPELRPLLGVDPQPGFPKRLQRIDGLFDAPPLATCRPAALVFPEIVREGPSAVHALDPGEALLRLVPDALLTETASTQRHLATFGALLAQVRCYRVESGPDLPATAALVRDLV